MINGFLQDVRYALRQLQKSPGFLAATIITLGLGIGANTAIFSMVNSILLRPWPVPEPQRLVNLAFQDKKTGPTDSFSYLDFEDIRQQSTDVFSGITAVRPFQMDGLSFNGAVQNIWTLYVTGNYFEVMGVKPAMGRLIQPSEGATIGSDPVLVLSYSYWKTHFQGDPGIIGAKATVSGRPVTIIGVAPERFRGFSSILDIQGYLPLSVCTFEGRKDAWTARDDNELLLLARMKTGVGIAKSEPALNLIARRLAQAYPQLHEGMMLHAYRLQPIGPDSGPPDFQLVLISAVFLTLALLVLLLACLNVANLVLVRATMRQREVALRAAIGASRGRLVRQLLTETALLALLGCLVGVAVGIVASRGLSSIRFGSDLPLTLDFSFDWRVFAYAMAGAVLATIVIGVAPALRTTGAKLGDVLHDSARTVTARRQRLRSALVVAQVAGSLMLLVMAGLFVRSMINAQSASLGFDPRHVVNFTLDPRTLGYDDQKGAALFRDWMERVRSIPGVQSSSLAASVPMGYYNYDLLVKIAGRPGAQPEGIGSNSVSPGYFETMGIRLLRGRDFSPADSAQSQYVAVINQAMAEQYWPKQDPLGKHFSSNLNGQDHDFVVIGVVNNSLAYHVNLTNPIDPYVYTSLAQRYISTETLQVRTDIAPQAVIRDVTAIANSLYGAPVPLFDVQTMARALGTFNGLLLFELGAGLAAAMGLLGLTLAIVGIYGVLSYSTAQRTHEIGIRMALGAQPRDVLRIVLRQGLPMIGLGITIGILAATGMGRVVGSLLVGVGGMDPITYIALSLLLALVSLLASYIPAARAAKVDPMVALRCE
ncbi:MAG TPA: ABC transporter permease [Dongiaceae bacterium]|nr:ABC transporter permease [Dongiaceae bacterium]